MKITLRSLLLASASAFSLAMPFLATAGTVSLHTAYRYYRFSVTGLKQGASGYEAVQMTEVALYDAAGNRLNQGIAYMGANLGTTALIESSFTCIPNNHGEGTPANLVDGDTSTKSYNSGNAFNATDHAFRLVMRLADTAAPVAGYNICTGNDDVWAWGAGRCRTPASWTLEASNDGVTWMVLAQENDSELSIVANSTWLNDGIPIPVSNLSGVAYFVPTGDSLAIDQSGTFHTIVNNGTVSIAGGATAAWDVASGETVKLQGGALAGSGTLEKRGEGELAIGGGDNSAFAGKIDAKAGTLRFLRTAESTAFTYYRICLKGKESNSSGGFQLSELALYDETGNRINLGLTSAGGTGNQYASIGSMAASTYAFNKNGTSAWVGESGSQMTDKLFDGDLGTKLYGGNLTPSASSYPYLVMRLADDAPAVAAYNLATGNDTGSYPDRHIVSWSLEGSMDGQCWVVLDERTNDPGAVRANGVWYNAGRAYPVARPVVSRKARYYRLRLKGKYADNPNNDAFELGEFALYDASGNRLNLNNLAFAGKNVSPGNLEERSFAFNQGTLSHIDIRPAGHNEGPEKLLDGDVGTKVFGWARPTASATPFFVFRLADDAPPVATYNIASGNDVANNPYRHINAWSLECSDDGTDWIVLDESVAADPRAPLVNKAWFNQGVTMPCTQNGVGGASMPTNATLAVASGATISLPSDQAGSIAGLEIDCGNGAGTIENFTAASGMTLNLTNFRAFKDDTVATGKALPITFSGATDLSTLDTWTILINGNATKGENYRAILMNGVLAIRGSEGTLLYIR